MNTNNKTHYYKFRSLFKMKLGILKTRVLLILRAQWNDFRVKFFSSVVSVCVYVINVFGD